MKNLLLLATVLFISININAQTIKLYVSVKGAKQGNINGGVTEKGKENKIAAYSYSYTASNSAGKKSQTGITITKSIDKSSPLLYTALATNENLTEVIMQFWEPMTSASGNGSMKQFYTVKLTGATITRINQTSAVTDANKTGAQLMEEITFSYQKIEMTITDGGIMAEDNWNANAVIPIKLN